MSTINAAGASDGWESVSLLSHQLLVNLQHRFAFGGVHQHGVHPGLQFDVGRKACATGSYDASGPNAFADLRCINA